MVRTSVYHDLQGSLSQNDAIYLQSNRVAKMSQICLLSHRTRSDIGSFWWILPKN
jgi:hypothetical protein